MHVGEEKKKKKKKKKSYNNFFKLQTWLVDLASTSQENETYLFLQFSAKTGLSLL